MNLKECAKSYVPRKTLNIADLGTVELDFEVDQDEGLNSKGEKFLYYYCIIGGDKYRIPNPVLEQIQGILKRNPACKAVDITSKGIGLSITYQVLPAN